MKRKLQWEYPEIFGKHFYFAVLGGLHIEQQLLKICGQLVRGSGLDDIMGKANLSYIGLKTAFTDVNDIKKAFYSLQIIVICLYKQLKTAHYQSKSNLSIDEWAKSQSAIMFNYWYKTLKFQITTLMTVRCFRETNLILLIGCLKEAVSLCFSLDHINYSRWVSVHIHDLETLRNYLITWERTLESGLQKQNFQRLHMISDMR